MIGVPIIWDCLSIPIMSHNHIHCTEVSLMFIHIHVDLSSFRLPSPLHSIYPTSSRIYLAKKRSHSRIPALRQNEKHNVVKPPNQASQRGCKTPATCTIPGEMFEACFAARWKAPRKEDTCLADWRQKIGNQKSQFTLW